MLYLIWNHAALFASICSSSRYGWAFYFLSSSVHIFINLIVMRLMFDPNERQNWIFDGLKSICSDAMPNVVMNSIAPFFSRWQKKICSTCPTHVYLQFTTFARRYTRTHIYVCIHTTSFEGTFFTALHYQILTSYALNSLVHWRPCSFWRNRLPFAC